MTALSVVPVVPADVVFAHALRGEPCFLVDVGPVPVPLPVEDWTRPADTADQALVALCDGPTLDVGCGPGRLTVELAGRGTLALGIDVVREAVAQALQRGAAALHLDVFGPIPGAGRWHTVLLADGNIGIGGDPAGLLDRVRRLLGPRGRVVVEVGAPGMRSRRVTGRLECACSTSEPFPWAVVGVDDVARIATMARLVETQRVEVGGRWAVVLQELST